MEDAWYHVLSHVSQRDLLKVERVSRGMKRMGRREWALRKEVDIQQDFPAATSEQAHIISLIGKPFIAFLSRPLLTSHWTSCIGSRGQIIDDGQFSIVKDDHQAIVICVIEEISKRCTRLKKLEIHRMTLTLNALLAFPLLPCTLEVFFICIYTYSHNKFEELSLTICQMDCYSPEEGRLAQEAMTTLVSSLPSLRRFEISGRGAAYADFVLDERVLNHLPDSVTHLNLSAGNSLKLADLQFVKQRELDSFTLHRSFICSRDLEGLVAISPNIRRAQKAIHSIVEFETKKINSISHLDLSNSRNITDFIAISKLQFLKTLILSGNRDLRDEHLNAMCRGCPALIEVDLEHCAKLTSDGLVSLGLLHSLRRLSLSGLPSVNLAVIEALTRCIDLVKLDVSFCRNVNLQSVPVAAVAQLFKEFLSHSEVEVSCLAALLSDFPLLRLVVMKGNTLDMRMVNALKGESIFPFLECDPFKVEQPAFTRPPPLPLL
ncbi:hypothetical protein PRIPAC_77057 [Pristionchus pacificus]|uniref:Uncharacterized protein n=1 Tax=Pristionchus pacificus TaxID=54126 RepID=A0A2A6BY78_PRIPA|nr:hypothetical protein PRIPAC_77057 [Pristionchus pacificus]|eukprot:PDM70721.1 hypothetical protein PRIPAC_44925 [Pristionchus pacificus]